MPPTPSRRRGGGLPSLGLVQLLIGLPPLALLLTTLWYYRWHTLEHEAAALSPAALGQPRDLLLDSHQVEEWVARRRSQIVEWSLAHQREHAEHQARVSDAAATAAATAGAPSAAAASGISDLLSLLPAGDADAPPSAPSAQDPRPERAAAPPPFAQAAAPSAPIAASPPAAAAGAERAEGAAGAWQSVVEDGRCGPDGIVALTYASHGGRDDRFCRSVESAIRNHVPLRVLGWGVPWEGLSQKLTAALTAVRALPSDCVVTFTDAYDVLYTEELAAVRRKFDALQAGAPAPLVFSGECGCWPQVTRDKGVTCRDKYPRSPTPYRYLNSGGWIGYAGAAAEFLQALVDAGGGAKGKAFHKLNDQELASDMYMTGAHDITLDHYNTIFQAMHAIHDGTAVPNCDPWPHMREEDGVWHNDETSSRPAIYHFNGGGKEHHLKMEARTWWKTKSYARAPEALDAVRSTRLRFHDQVRTFEDICPGHLKKK